ncbi:hypothetical protein GCM10023339_41250 [Alloalcanivorax gelatiniphagus]
MHSDSKDIAVIEAAISELQREMEDHRLTAARTKLVDYPMHQASVTVRASRQQPAKDDLWTG